MDNFEFANKIYTLRTEKGISQKELGEMLGVSNKAVSKWENGESMPKTATLLKIAEMFNLDISELMGGEPKQAEADSAQNEEINSLMAENARLRSQITQSDKRKKLTTVIAALLCVAVIAATGVFAFWTGITDAENKEIKDLGKDGTTITFAGCTFEPLAPLDETVTSFDTQYLSDTKDATYADLDGKKTKISISCDNYSDYICVNRGGKKYWYINKNKHLKINRDSIGAIELLYGKSVANGERIGWRYSGAYYSADDSVQAQCIEDFIRFYKTKKETENNRIAEYFLGNNGCTVRVELTEKYNMSDAEIGEFFTDAKGDVYYYDYSDTKTYDVGKEMAEHVTRNN